MPGRVSEEEIKDKQRKRRRKKNINKLKPKRSYASYFLDILLIFLLVLNIGINTVVGLQKSTMLLGSRPPKSTYRVSPLFRDGHTSTYTFFYVYNSLFFVDHGSKLLGKLPAADPFL